jgi:2-dehydro-3-deoxygalactonokinase
MAAASVVAGDWGTTHLRLFLCDADGGVLDQLTGPGAAETAGRFADTFQSLTAGWGSHGRVPAVLCGMVGSNIGWTQAPYVACPANPEQIVEGCVALLAGRVHIVPGLSCRNRCNGPDFLRGEETQVLGAMMLQPELRHGRRLLCLPGTHTKWVALDHGRVVEFLTAPAGELYAILCDHSVLVRKPNRTATPLDSTAFRQGLAHFNECPEADLLHRLFECRARQLSGDLAAQSADAYLSGLLISADVRGALRLLDDAAAQTVHLIGAPQLTQLYSTALGLHGRLTTLVDGTAASLAGLMHVHRRLAQVVVT